MSNMIKTWLWLYGASRNLWELETIHCHGLHIVTASPIESLYIDTNKTQLSLMKEEWDGYYASLVAESLS